MSDCKLSLVSILSLVEVTRFSIADFQIKHSARYKVFPYELLLYLLYYTRQVPTSVIPMRESY